MIKINLLPWREKEYQKKSKKIIVILLVFLVILFFLIVIKIGWSSLKNHKSTHTVKSHESHAHRVISQNRLIAETTNTQASHRGSTLYSLDLDNVKLTNTLDLFCKVLNLNLIIHPAVKGTVSLHLAHLVPEDMFNTLLSSYDLIRYRSGKAWMIEPKSVFVRHQQDQLKLKRLSDETDPLITKIWQIRFAKAEEIGHVLQENNAYLFSKRGHFSVDPRTNSLCVQDTACYLAHLHSIIHSLDTPVKQVLIEARLASVDTEFEQELGIHFETLGSDQTQTKMLPESCPLSRYSLAVAKLADGNLLDLQLTALENEGHGELISSPRLFTSNQQPASIESGEEIPYQEVSESGATSVAFKKAVLSLKVTPQVMPDDYVLLQLQVNQDKPNNHLVLGVPSISTRQISTQVLIKNGQTIVLGGIYEANTEQSFQRIPFLSNIPFLGMIFQRKNHRDDKRELLIFVTPKVFFQTEKEKRVSHA